MKLYNHISTWAFAGLLAFTGCSQEESLEGSSSLQGFQISVSDAGFQKDVLPMRTSRPLL